MWCTPRKGTDNASARPLARSWPFASELRMPGPRVAAMNVGLRWCATCLSSSVGSGNVVRES